MKLLLAFIFLIILAAQAHAALVEVQVETGTVNGTAVNTATMTYLAAATVGNLNVCVGMYSGNASLPSVTRVDDNGSTESAWTVITTTAQLTNSLVAMAYTKSAAAAFTKVWFTWSLSESANKEVGCWEVSGADPTNPFDVSFSSSNEPSTTTPLGAVCNPTNANSFCAAAVFPSGSVTANPKAGNEYTNNVPSTTGIFTNGNAMCSLITTNTGIHQPQWTTSAGTFAGLTAAFKQAAAGGAQKPTRTLTGAGL